MQKYSVEAGNNGWRWAGYSPEHVRYTDTRNYYGKDGFQYFCFFVRLSEKKKAWEFLRICLSQEGDVFKIVVTHNLTDVIYEKEVFFIDGFSRLLTEVFATVNTVAGKQESWY